MKHRLFSGLFTAIIAFSGLASLSSLASAPAHAAGFDCRLLPNSEVTAAGMGAVANRRNGGPLDCTIFTQKGIVMFFNNQNPVNSNTSLPPQYSKGTRMMNGHLVYQDNRIISGCGDAMAYGPVIAIVSTPNCQITDKLAQYITSHM